MTARRAKSRMTVGNRTRDICCLTCQGNGRQKPHHRRDLNKAIKAAEKQAFHKMLAEQTY